MEPRSLRAGRRISPVTVGRVDRCEISHRRSGGLPSALHARGARRPQLVVTDLESANGTFLNERPVRSRRRPCRATVIRVGSTDCSILGRPGAPRGLESMRGRRRDRDDGVGHPQANRAGARSTGCRPFDDQRRRLVRPVAPAARAAAPEDAASGSEVLAGARDLQALADAALESILDVTGRRPRGACAAAGRDDDRGGRRRGGRGRTASPERFTLSRTLVSDTIDQGRVDVRARRQRRRQRFSERRASSGSASAR